MPSDHPISTPLAEGGRRRRKAPWLAPVLASGLACGTAGTSHEAEVSAAAASRRTTPPPAAPPGDVQDANQGQAPVSSTADATDYWRDAELAELGCTPPAGMVLAASTWPVSVKPFSAWTPLAPWAFWAVAASRPEVIVELGTHHGGSYFLFCQAIAATGLPTRAFAVDSWRGDDHTGFYDGQVFAAVDAYNRRHYGKFSTLLRMPFDAALAEIADGSVGLLHIDGQHYYENARHDFEAWLPKLNRGAVVFFHAINVRAQNCGVHKLWGELERRYPSFAFRQGAGLGILGVGDQLPQILQTLFSLGDGERACVHRAYAILGERVCQQQSPASLRN